jgi:hypothetical protein
LILTNASLAPTPAQDLRAIDDSTVPYLILTEPERSVANQEEPIASQAGQIIRDCRARAFETTGLYEDHSPTAEMPIVAENFDSIACVINAAEEKRIGFEFEARWSSAVTDEMRSRE